MSDSQTDTVINIPNAFKKIDAPWDPHVAGDVNNAQVKIAKLSGAFDWHAHENEDEAFFVISGSFDLELRDRTLTLGEGDFFVVPRGVEHRPVAHEEWCVMLIEPASTLNTGDQHTEKTKSTLKRV